MTALLEVDQLTVKFGPVTACDRVSLSLRQGEVLALVGASGSGKSTLARAIVGLVKPTSGSIRYAGKELLGLSSRALRPVRRKLQIIFQDPYASLSPNLTVEELVGEGLAVHRLASGALRRQQVSALLSQVGLPEDALRRHPHQFSDGQRQRIAIARALAVEPELLIADEPVTSLDVSIQGQIVNLLLELQRKRSMTMLWVSHDLAIVEHVATRVAVMRAGQLVEIAPTAELLARPQHAYTQALLAARR